MTRLEQEKFKKDNGLRFTEHQSDEKETLKKELNCIEMIDSIICYGKQDFDYVITDHYLEKYINELGFERVKTLVINQLNEKPYIKRNVYTDCDGLTYNSLIFKDEEGYILKEA